MAVRFRRSIKLAPGVRMNLGLSGMSMTLGPRGASMSVGRQGPHVNLGIPGTGLSTRQRVSHSAGSQSSKMVVQFRLKDDGTVDIVDAEGLPLPPRLAKIARAQNTELLQNWLSQNCDQLNKGTEAILGIHLETPSPHEKPIACQRIPFDTPRPASPQLRSAGILEAIIKPLRTRLEAHNAEMRNEHSKAVSEWERARAAHERTQRQLLRLFDPSINPTSEEIQDFILKVMGRIAWPRETTVSLEVSEDATRVQVDIDLPEMEDMPDKSATVAARGLKLNIKDRPESQRRREYMQHVHGVVFRVIGEIFHAWPRCMQIVCSGYSQRASKLSGQVSDEYLLSVRVSREAWNGINFKRLCDIDLPNCLGTFEIRREMSANAVFKSIQPFDATPDVAHAS